MYRIQETVETGQLLHYDPIRNVLKRPEGRDVPRVSRLGVRGDIRSYTRRDSLGYRSVLGHGQQLMGQLANEGLGKNKIGRLAIRNLGLRCGSLETSKVYKNSSDSASGLHDEWALTNEMETMNYPVTVSHLGLLSGPVYYTKWILTVGWGLCVDWTGATFLAQVVLATAVMLNPPKVNANVSLPILFHSLGGLTSQLVTHWLAQTPYIM